MVTSYKCYKCLDDSLTDDENFRLVQIENICRRQVAEVPV